MIVILALVAWAIHCDDAKALTSDQEKQIWKNIYWFAPDAIPVEFKDEIEFDYACLLSRIMNREIKQCPYKTDSIWQYHFVFDNGISGDFAFGYL
mgnify:CR=1 FL=1